MSEVIEKQAAQQSKSARILDPQRMALAEVMRQDWVVNAEDGTTVEEVLDPAYWAHMAAQLQPFDRIDVRLETGEWMLELLVINTGRNWAHMHLLHKHELVKRAETMPHLNKHDVAWKGPQLKWCVVRLADGEILHRDAPSKTAAAEWLTAYQKTTGA